MRSAGRILAARLTALALGVFALSLASITFTAGHGHVAAIWPANALVLAFLLSHSLRAWPACLMAALAGYVGANMVDGGAVAPALALAGANSVEVVLAALLCRPSIGSDVDVTRPRHLLSLGVGAAVAPLASALIAQTVMPDGGETFVRWYLADALGLVVVTPALLALARELPSLGQLVRRPENAPPVLALAAALVVVFGQADYPVQFLIFPPLIWCAFRLGAGGTAVVLLATAAVAVVAVLGGHGATARLVTDMQIRLTVLQVLLAAITVISLPLAAALAERRRLDVSLREALAKANDSEARYRTLADNATDVIATFDKQTRFTFLSPSIKTVLGYEPEELIGQRTRDIMHPDDYRSSLDAYRAQLEAGGGDAFLFEYRAVRKDGGMVWLAGHSRALRDPETGELTGFIDVVRNITESKAAERALAESETRYRMLADNASDMVFSYDADGTISYASPSVAKLGYAPEDLIGQASTALIHPDDAAALGQRIQSMASTGLVEPDLDRTFRFRTKSGDYVWVEANPSIILDDAGRPASFVTQVRDISARKAFEDALAASEARYRSLADNASDLVLKFNIDAVIEYASPSVAALGYTPEEMVGRHALDLLHPDDVAGAAERTRAILETGSVGPAVDRTYRVRTKDGGYVWMEGNPSVIHDAAGKTVGVVSQLRDITTRREAEAALAASEARYRLLADNASDLVIKIDDKGILTYISPSVRQLGYEPDELTGTSPLTLVHPEDRAVVGARMLERRKTGVVEDDRPVTYRVLSKDGRHVWVESKSSVVRKPDGSLDAIISQLRDVTTRHQHEAALAESEARYRLLADNASDIVIKIMANGIVEYASPSIARLGYTPEELLGRSGLEMVHPDDVADVADRVRAMMDTGEVDPSRERVYRVRTKDESYVWVEGNPSVILDERGRAHGIITQLRDVTARREAELALAESEARYRTLADHSTDIILKVDMADTILYVSPSVRRYGYEPEDLIGRCGFDLAHPDDAPKLRELIEELFQTGQVDPSRDRTYRLRTASGEYIWGEGNPSLVRNEAGEVEAVISQLRDVSVRKELEAELLAARDDAQAAAATKAEFMANMSHEIRTPLTAVLGFTAMLAKRSGLQEDARRQVDRIGAAGEAMLAIVNDILDFSKIEAGLMPVTPRPAQPLEMLENALALFEPHAAAKGLELKFETRDLPDTVSLDPDRVRQVLLNLIGNAVKFTQAGSVGVTARYEDGRLKVAVRDTGAGMDEAQQAKLFQRFSQVDGAAARAGGGTGLGLAISLGLVEAMGGKIGLTSAPGEGSTFAFEIPAPVCDAGVGIGVADVETPQSAVAGLRVLLADDNATNREIAAAVMAQFEIEVTEAANGADAIELASLLPYDVILLDLRMPVMDGPTAVRRLRGEAGPNRTTPILAFSADHELEAEIADLFDGHVRKPIEVAPLLEALVRMTAWEEAVYAAEA